MCTPGHTGPDGGPCLECLAGKFKSGNGTSHCSLCEEGTYSDLAASTGCKKCPFQSNAPPQSDQVFDCICNPGYTGADGTPCTECSTGKYKVNSGPENCTLCGAGFYSPVIASFEASSCIPCVPGKFSKKQAAAFATECMDCDAGTYAEVSASLQCIDCLAGKYLPDTGSSNQTHCRICEAGTYSDAGSSTCVACQAGTYSLDAASACIVCPVDTYSSSEKATSCLNCTLTYCEIGEYRQRCKPGSVLDGMCSNCTYTINHTMFIDHGEYNDTCPFVCEPPYKPDCSTGQCKRCDPGTVSVGMYSGTYSDGIYRDGEWLWSCRGCPEGGECDGSEDVVCSPQRYKTVPGFPLVTEQKCEKCPVGGMCFDGGCSLPSFKCPYPDTTVIIGQWERQQDNPTHGRYELVSCPSGMHTIHTHKRIDPILKYA